MLYLNRHYGVGINSDMVLDAQASTIGIVQQTGAFRMQNYVKFHYFPLVTNFADDNIVVKGLSEMTLPFVSSLDTTISVPDGVSREVIAWSSENSAVETGTYNFDPFRRFSRSFFNRSHVPLAAVYKGLFPSYFSDKPTPEYAGSDTTFNPLDIESEIVSAEARMIVVADANFADDRNINETNAVFLMNILDWLSQDEGLISIRSKRVASRPLMEVSDGTKKFTKYLNMLTMPILVIIFGVFKWQIRRSGKKKHI